jgi:tetratricopeptide (TPR) repeat protein
VEVLVRETLERARKVGNPRAMALCAHALGAVLQLAGRWLDSARALNESIELCGSFEGTFGLVLGEQRLGQIESAVGLFEAADKRLQGALNTARTSTSTMVRAHSLGRIYATLAVNSYDSGELQQATRYVARGFAVQREVGDCAGCDVLLYPAAVPVYIARGELDRAESAVRKAAETAAAFQSRAWVATARYLAGLLACAHSDWRAATGHFEESATTFEKLGQPYSLARSLESLAVAQSHVSSTPGKAVERLVHRAAGHYREVGATVRAAKVEELLAAAR